MCVALVRASKLKKGKIFPLKIGKMGKSRPKKKNKKAFQKSLEKGKLSPLGGREKKSCTGDEKGGKRERTVWKGESALASGPAEKEKSCHGHRSEKGQKKTMLIVEKKGRA